MPGVSSLDPNSVVGSNTPIHCQGPGNSATSIHKKRTDIRVLELFASTRREPWSHTHQERKRLLPHPPEERMRRGQGKSTFNNRKPNMTPPETRNHTPARPEHHNADEAEENDLKNIFMKLIKDLKEDIRKSLKEMKEKPNQKIQDINKSLKETVQDLKTEIETIKKAQSEGILEIEKLRWMHLGCFQVLAITNNAAMNLDEETSLLYECASFRYMPKSGIAGS
ncbi:GTPase IMAP family member 3-like protein [Cricetulus griseus]|nr:GTPase IMAP family member 3-like protein [Cricetulus griseus]